MNPANAKTPRKSTLQKTILSIFCLLIWTFASLIFSQLLIGLLMMSILGDTFSETVPTAIYSALSYIFATFLIIFVPTKISFKKLKNHQLSAKPSHINRTELGLRGLPTWTDIGLSIAGLISALILAAILTSLFSIFPWFDANELQDVGYSLSISGPERLIAFFSLVIIAPIMEELIFRGWLYAKLRTKFSEITSEKLSIIFSIFLTSLLFGLIHGQWNVGVSVFALSVIMCGLREITGTIYAGILVHMLKNGLAFYLLYIQGM